MFRVVATQQGFHNQRLREPGEVFDLLVRKDGTYRHATRNEPILSTEGVPIPGRFKKVEVPAKDGYGRPFQKNGKAVPEHADYAEDKGNVGVTEGPNAGESIHLGWMYKVPDSVPIGQYPPNTDFWADNLRLPQPYVVEVAPGSRSAAPIKTFDDDPVRVIAPGTKGSDTGGTGPRPPGMA
jgi:hypothetical protein